MCRPKHVVRHSPFCGCRLVSYVSEAFMDGKAQTASVGLGTGMTASKDMAGKGVLEVGMKILEVERGGVLTIRRRRRRYASFVRCSVRR